jgi:hypothetical protein
MSVQHANRGVVKKDLQLYYNREFIKSFRGQATTNIAYATNNFLNSNSNWWVNSGNAVFNDNDTSIDKPIILNVDTSNLRIFSSTVTAVGNQQLGSSIIPISGSTQYSMSIYYWFSGGSMQAPPYVRANINNNELAYFGYNGDTNYLNWPRRTWIRLTATFTTQANETGVYMSSYTGDTAGEKLAYFGYQIEQKAYVTPLVLGSRTANTVAGGGGLLDISGNNVNADLTNVSFDSTGYIFGGSANYIDLPSSTFLDFNLNNFSIFTWIKSSATGNFGNIFNNMNVAGTLGVQFLTKPSNGGCRVWVGDLSHDNTVNVTNGSWNYIGFVRDGDYVYFYVNGSLSTTGTGFAAKNATPNSGNDRRIGRQTTNTAYDFNGQISNFKIYSRLLTAAEVLQNFNATRKTYGI